MCPSTASAPVQQVVGPEAPVRQIPVLSFAGVETGRAGLTRVHELQFLGESVQRLL